jgi:ferric-dicitrate binding protein FerR (iron transport regulator)
MDLTRLDILFRRYYDKTASPAEEKELMQLIQLADPEDLEKLILDKGAALEDIEPVMDGERAEMIFNNILQREQPAPRRILYWKSIAVAASVLLVAGTGVYLGLLRKNQQREIVGVREKKLGNDIDPGKYRARLTLADGKSIVLDSAASGKLATQGNAVIFNQNGKLVYSQEAAAGGKEVMYNTLSTERGETYATVLSDGTRIWLNAASSVRFPVAFAGNERRVEISGEAYFEVAKDASKPFKVLVDGLEVQVLGTQFNLNAYRDEKTIKTTLLEGSVRLTKDSESSVLLPGQQGRVLRFTAGEEMKKGGIISVSSDVDMREVMAWKNDRFYIAGGDIKLLMRQIARWYDVEVIYGQGAINDLFYAEIPRDTKLSNVLEALEHTGKVHFSTHNRQITVLP